MSALFDNTPPRKNTYSFKWQKYQGKDIIPAWVADTEFRCAQPILDTLSAQIEHGNMGYILPAHHQGAINAVVRWLKDKHNWDIDPSWLVWTPGVVPAFNVACKAYCEAGDKVLIQTPNYPPLLAAPKLNGLERVDIGTVIETSQDNNGNTVQRYTIDFEALEREAADPKCKLFILCNPMNPVGSVLTQSEIDRIAAICNKNNVTLCSDEIHCDLILEPGKSHIPAGREAALAENSITLMAASKTFNVAGLGTSFAIIPNAKLRQAFTSAAAGIVPWVTVLGLAATEAAFTLCDDWHQAQLSYLRENRNKVFNAINQIEGLNMLKADATFLAWVDASGLNVDNVLNWAEEKGVGPSPGVDFHKADHFRINFGCSSAMLDDILSRLAK
ncbi:aspartate aminotransferase [Alteromonas sp. KUL42]|uniref:MalY/PatB family protein n=1 Tax=Alteromonas sp. KUL42 TaxID=2480797 RepID=UPI0010368C42|nr:aminotransferase class I/II-fold pyridoxal phosphate-dependent enzyme [Alteromonas sp. KUL42]TAP38075.1 aminotransferase class I/II-fold pyridoxal phosphate-dependent enzyme [Alteromonas sp. KUL42]GEA05273.1 aspartate aminotransferase [Alteromonas sp. KUL42]